MNKPKANQRQKGFTLIEVLVVVVLIGILSTLIATQVGANASNGARAKTLYASAQKIATAWNLIVMQTGVSSNPADTALAASPANTALDIIMLGDDPSGLVASAYASAFSRIGVKPMGDIAEVAVAPAVGTAGQYRIIGYPVTLAAGGAGKLNIVYAGVSREVLREVFESQTGGTLPASVTAAWATGKIQYSAPAADGTFTLTIQLSA